MPRLLDPVLPGGTLRDRPQPTISIDDEVALRPWRVGDAATLVDAYADPDIAFWHHRAMSEGEAATWVEAAADGWEHERDAEWAVAGPGGVVGRVALRGISLDIGQAEVSYWTLPLARGTGHARRAVDRLAGWALDEVGFWRLVVRHSTANAPSCLVAEHAGFACEAQLARCHLHADGWHDVHVHTRFRAAGEATATCGAPEAAIPDTQ